MTVCVSRPLGRRRRNGPCLTRSSACVTRRCCCVRRRRSLAGGHSRRAVVGRGARRGCATEIWCGRVGRRITESARRKNSRCCSDDGEVALHDAVGAAAIVGPRGRRGLACSYHRSSTGPAAPRVIEHERTRDQGSAAPRVLEHERTRDKAAISGWRAQQMNCCRTRRELWMRDGSRCDRDVSVLGWVCVLRTRNIPCWALTHIGSTSFCITG